MARRTPPEPFDPDLAESLPEVAELRQLEATMTALEDRERAARAALVELTLARIRLGQMHPTPETAAQLRDVERRTRAERRAERESGFRLWRMQFVRRRLLAQVAQAMVRLRLVPKVRPGKPRGKPRR